MPPHDMVMTNSRRSHSVVFTALYFTAFAANGPLPTDHIPANRVGANINVFTAKH